MLRRLAALAFVALASACLYDWSLPSDAGADAQTDAACGSVTLGPCDGLPFRSGFVQQIDGKDDEFCQIPFKNFDLGDSAFRTCPKPSWIASPDVTATYAAVASEDGLHVFVRVDKNGMPVERNDEDAGEAVYLGDALELFYATASTPTGSLTADDAVQIIVAPPGPSGSPPAAISGVTSPQWIAQTSGSTWVAELFLPWSTFGRDAAPPSMLTDFALDARHQGDRFQGFDSYVLDAGKVFCNTDPTPPKPASSDLSWCNERVQ